MKKITLIIVMGALVVATACNNAKENKNTATAESKDTAKAAAGPKMDSTAMMKAYMAYMTPGDMQKMLASMSGDWTGDITMWMSPGAPPAKNTGFCSNKMIMGGRYMLQENKGSWGGMPYEGASTIGFDNAKKIFVSSSVDNMGTGMMNLEGPYDSSAKAIILKGKEIDPMTGKEFAVREVLKITDADNQMMEMYATQDGKEYKNMEIKYTRKK